VVTFTAETKTFDLQGSSLLGRWRFPDRELPDEDWDGGLKKFGPEED
jgi:hypothetical protein